jgi:hypothetical protein
VSNGKYFDLSSNGQRLGGRYFWSVNPLHAWHIYTVVFSLARPTFLQIYAKSNSCKHSLVGVASEVFDLFLPSRRAYTALFNRLRQRGIDICRVETDAEPRAIRAH